VRISAKADYAVRAMAELAAAEPDATLKAEELSRSQDIPLKFLLNILVELKHAGLVQSHRGADGGYSLAMPARSISVADVIRVVEGPLATVRETRPESLRYTGAASRLQAVWIAVRSSLRSVLETVTLADIEGGPLPPAISRLAARPDAWISYANRVQKSGGDEIKAPRSIVSHSRPGRPPHAPSRKRQ
jgi:Rrf2 family protein